MSHFTGDLCRNLFTKKSCTKQTNKYISIDNLGKTKTINDALNQKINILFTKIFDFPRLSKK